MLSNRRAGGNPSVQNAATVSACVGVLECCMHHILYRRGVYPSGAFVRKRAFDCPVYQCLHPQVQSYIATALVHAKQELEQEHLQAVYLDLCDSSRRQIVERWQFSVRGISLTNQQPSSVDRNQQLHSAFRTMLLRLHVSDALEQQGQAGDTFQISLECGGGSLPDNWVVTGNASKFPGNDNSEVSLLPVVEARVEEFGLDINFIKK